MNLQRILSDLQQRCIVAVLLCVLALTTVGCDAHAGTNPSDTFTDPWIVTHAETSHDATEDLSSLIYQAIIQTEYKTEADRVTAEYVAFMEEAIRFGYDPIHFIPKSVCVIPFESFIDYPNAAASFSLRLYDQDGKALTLSITDPLTPKSAATAAYDGVAAYPQLQADPPYDAFPLYRRYAEQQALSFSEFLERFYSESDVSGIASALEAVDDPGMEPLPEAEHYYTLLLKVLYENEVPKADYVTFEIIPRPTEIQTKYAMLGREFALLMTDAEGNRIVFYKSQSGSRPHFIATLLNGSMIAYKIIQY